MEGNILDAIRKAFSDVEDLGPRHEKKPPESVFMNRSRQEIFSYLCQRPCSALANISRDLKMSSITVKWHLEKLVAGKFIVRASAGKKTVFYPFDFIEPAQTAILSCLNENLPKRVMSIILRSGGVSQKELCASLGIGHQTVVYNISKLRKSGLVSAMRDGKYTRYYSTGLLPRMRESGMRRIGQFRKNFLKMLRMDGVSPRVAHSTYGELHVEISRGSDKSILIFHTDPFATVLA